MNVILLGPVTITDMQAPPPPPLRNGQNFKNFMRDVECAEWSGKNNKKILRFLFVRVMGGNS